MTRVIVHIDRLVLYGIHPEDQKHFAEGLQTELGRLLQLPGAAERLVSMGHRPRLKTDRIAHPPEGPPEPFGVAVAATMMRSLLR